MNTDKTLSTLPIYLQIINKYFEKHKIPKNEFRVPGKYKSTLLDNTKDIIANEDYFELETINRLLTAKHKNKLAKKLNKANYSVFIDRSWLFIKNVSKVSYIFKIYSVATDKQPTFKNITICTKKDKRAGQDIYKYLRANNFEYLGNSSYVWKKYGFKVKTFSKLAIKTLKKAYKKCKFIIKQKPSERFIIKIKFRQ